eukprot:GCRY01004924.1.p1 GENE.GCRY01004924.1~~GCRY01004924.1.p1  ORF type:complete len:269 (+),score=32.77 GCRY01004924.1:59-865(+)
MTKGQGELSLVQHYYLMLAAYERNLEAKKKATETSSPKLDSSQNSKPSNTINESQITQPLTREAKAKTEIPKKDEPSRTPQTQKAKTDAKQLQNAQTISNATPSKSGSKLAPSLSLAQFYYLSGCSDFPKTEKKAQERVTPAPSKKQQKQSVVAEKTLAPSQNPAQKEVCASQPLTQNNAESAASFQAEEAQSAIDEANKRLDNCVDNEKKFSLLFSSILKRYDSMMNVLQQHEQEANEVSIKLKAVVEQNSLLEQQLKNLKMSYNNQ